jgi:acetyl esterase/lipase
MRTTLSILFALLLAITLGWTDADAAEEEIDANMRITRDLVYRTPPPSDPKLTSLDLYRPLEGDDLPVMIFVHGGSWRAGDKGWDGSKPGYFTSQGYVFASINYRLSPEVQHPVHAQDVAHAIAWLHEHIAEYSGDPDRMFVLGHSSGAHLAALVATDERYLEEAGADLSVIKGVIVLDGGGYDIPNMVDSGELFSKGRYARAFSEDKRVWVDASPITHAEAGKGIPPFLLVHAWKRNASREQAEALASALREAGVRAELYHQPNKNHITINSDIGKEGDETTARIMQFLDSIEEGHGG